MNRNGVLKDIEDKLIKIGYSDENSVKALKEFYSYQLLEANSNDINFSNKDMKKIEKIYIDRIKKEKVKLNKEGLINSEKVKIVISTVSLTNISENILEELPLEKTLRVCENVERVYLFYSNEAERRFKKIKEKLIKKKIVVNKGMEENEKLDSENILSVRGFLFGTLKYLKEKGYKDEEIIIDLTVGTKISSVSMYKIAVENSIKAINWKEIYFQKYKEVEKNKFQYSENSLRIVFSTTLEVIKEILEENKVNLSIIGNAKKRKEYETVANLYAKLDRKNEEIFFYEYAKVFNQEVYLSFDVKKFSQKLKYFVRNILEYKEFSKSFKEKIKPLLLYLKIISDFSITSLNGYDEEFLQSLTTQYKKFISENRSKIKMDKDAENDYAIQFLMEYYSKEMRNFDLKTIDFDDIFEADEDENGIDNFINTMEEGVILLSNHLSICTLYEYLIGINIVKNFNFKNLFTSMNEVKEESKKNKLFSLFFREDLENYFINKVFGNYDVYNHIQSLFSLDYLIEDEDVSIRYREGVLEIRKYDIIIELEKEQIKLDKFANYLLPNILHKKNILRVDLKKIFNEKYLNEKTLEKNRSIFKKYVIFPLNEAIKKKLREKNYREIEDEDFIKVTHQNSIEKWIYKLNQKFY